MLTVSEWDDIEDYTIELVFYECRQEITPEQLYQMFKQRLLNDIEFIFKVNQRRMN